MLYNLLKKCTSLFFNLLNTLLGGRLPPFGSASVIVEDHDYYLVVELPGNRIVFPGGFMHWHEHPRQAAAREGREETGLTLHVGDLVNHYSITSHHWSSMSNICFVYAASVIGGRLRANVEGHPHWMHENELRTRIRGQALTILEDYLRYRTGRTSSSDPPPISLIS